MAAGGAGVGAGGAVRARHGRGRLAGRAGAPGRPTRAGAVGRRERHLCRAGAGERDRGRGGGGQPPAPPPRWGWCATARGAGGGAAALPGVFDPRPLAPPLQAVTSPLAIDVPAGPLGVVYTLTGGVFSIVFGLAILAGAGSLLVRFRRARGVERQQLRWVALAAALVPVAALIAVAASLIGGPAAATVITS